MVHSRRRKTVVNVLVLRINTRCDVGGVVEDGETDIFDIGSVTLCQSTTVRLVIKKNAESSEDGGIPLVLVFVREV